MSSPVGSALKRKEDARLLVGEGRYLDDIVVPRMLHAIIVRSVHAHARIVNVDRRAASAVPGVTAILTVADLPECGGPAVPALVPSAAMRSYRHPALGGPEVRHVGEAVAVVVADDVYRAADAAEALVIDYEVLPAAISVERALAPDAPVVLADWPDNVLGVATGGVGEAEGSFLAADLVIDAELAIPRVAPMPLEPRGILAVPRPPDGRFTVWTSTQVPYAVRAGLAAMLGLSEERLRVIAPDVGGGFGGKGHVYPEDLLIPATARRLGRPVKWVETRSEHFVAAAADRDQRHRARLGVGRDGTIMALQSVFTRDHGAYPPLGDVIALNSINHLPGPYRIPNYRGRGTNVVTHKPFTGAYRGAGRPEAAFVLDRLLDRAARALGMDPADFRRRNLIRPEQMPYRTGLTYRDGVAIVYDPADYPAAFDRTLTRLGYDDWRAEQKRRRGSSRLIGIGLSAYVEGTGIGPFEGADVRVDPDGTVYVLVGVSSQGQSHETTLAQVCAAELGVDPSEVVVLGGDTSLLGFGMGTIASRVAAVAGPAIARSARDVAGKARRVAAELLECAPHDIVLAGGRAHVAGFPERAVDLGPLARAAVKSRVLAAEGGPGLHACAFFYPETVTWAFGAHACVVEVDVETGAVSLLAYAASHDCGRPINPVVVEGQLHGGIAQGIGAALTEAFVYDEGGQLLTGSLMDYGLPRADVVPRLDIVPVDHPSIVNELGIKGVGESGIIAPPPAIANAIEDALTEYGVEITTLPLTPARVWAAMRRGGTTC
jgi:aerobic carbon-monoxide dehydrogenase large subunit